MNTRSETKKTRLINIRISEKLLKALKIKNINISATVRTILEAEVLKK